jgi:hypothetical protein
MKIGKFSYRSPDSMRDWQNGQTLDFDLCEPCLEEMIGWIKPLLQLEEDNEKVIETNDH